MAEHAIALHRQIEEEAFDPATRAAHDDRKAVGGARE